jgi:hypothetical protein
LNHGDTEATEDIVFSLAGRRRPEKKAIACGEGLFLPKLGVVSDSKLE